MAEIQGLDPGESIPNIIRLEDAIRPDGFSLKHQAAGEGFAYRFYEGPNSSVAVQPMLNGRPSLSSFDKLGIFITAETLPEARGLFETIQKAYVTQAA